MLRSSRTSELVFYPEVERTTRANRKENRQEGNLPTLTLSTRDFKSKREAKVSKSIAEHKILRELATPNVNQ
jgi:hypothetical protein